jgi:hypothetical protein
MELLRYGEPTIVYFTTSAPGAFVAGDVKIVIDGGVSANTNHLPVAVGAGYYLQLDKKEMEGEEIVISVVDQSAPKIWTDVTITINTWGSTDAKYPAVVAASILDTENNLITLQQLCDALDKTIITDGDDQKLERIINAASKFFNDRTNRLLKARANVEYCDGNGRDTLMVDNPPINSTPSTITICVDTDVPRTYPAANNYLPDSIVIYSKYGKIVLLDDSFYPGSQSIKVSYNGGYTTIPGDLEQACIEVCSMLWKREKDKLAGVIGISGTGGSINLDVQKALTPFAESVIEMYKRDLF